MKELINGVLVKVEGKIILARRYFTGRWGVGLGKAMEKRSHLGHASSVASCVAISQPTVISDLLHQEVITCC